MKIKTSELTGAALAWAVGMAEGYELSLYGVDPSIRARVTGLGVHAPWAPQRYWAQGGPIIDREQLSVEPIYSAPRKLDCWVSYGHNLRYDDEGEYICGSDNRQYSPTPLIAAMRCYVASKLGEEVDVPEELR